MPTEIILSTLLAGAAFVKTAAYDVANQSVRDAYTGLKAYLRSKLSAKPDALRAIDLATDKPESLLRKALLAEECALGVLENDLELARRTTLLKELLPVEACRSAVTVTGSGNHVQVAGRDIIHTKRVIRRNEITPDERHLTAEQRDLLKAACRGVAERLPRRNGELNFAAVHRLLKQQFRVASYLLIPSGQFDDAMKFLGQQLAMHRSRLRHHKPGAYQSELYRAIFAGARELGWDGETVYRFAALKLGHPHIASLKQLGPVELKKVADFMRSETRKLRRTHPSTTEASA